MPFSSIFTAEIREALGQEGCPVCRIIREAENRYFFWFVNENIHSLTTYEILANGGRLCHRHSWLLYDWAAKEGSLQSSATLYSYITDLLTEDLRLAHKSSQRKAGPFAGLSRRPLRPRVSRSPEAQNCWVCRSIGQTEDTFLHFLCASLDDDMEMKESYARSSGLCVAHLQAAFAKASAPVGSLLLQKAVSDLGQLKAQLLEYERKHDYRFRDEPWGEEKTSPQRAVSFSVGPRNSPVSRR